jgi:hypothetical protein
MKFKLLLDVAMFAVFVVACAKEAPPPPSPAPAETVAKAPETPKIVYASAEPQYGGVRQKVGDYMVELATGADGQVAAFIQKYEGDTPAFEDVQVEMQLTASAGDGQESAQEETKKGAEEATPEPHDVIFFVKDGKLQGTVAGLDKGTYDVSVKIYDITTDQMAEQNFTGVAVEPLDTSLKPEHGGTVKIVDKAKMEFVNKGKTVKIWFRDLEDKKIKPEEAQLTDLVVSTQDGVKETLNLETKGYHFETEVSGEIVPEQFKILMANLKIGEQLYPKIRIPNLAKVAVSSKKTVRQAPPATSSEAEKIDKPVKMKGTIGTMAVGKLPPGKIVSPKVKASVSVEGSASVGATKTKKAKVSTAKQAE